MQFFFESSALPGNFPINSVNPIPFMGDGEEEKFLEMMETDIVDQMGQPVRLVCPPRRIISLVPSQTELLFDLGLDEEVVGITKFCVHPQAWFQKKTKIGGTKDFRFDRIDELLPELIIGNKEENDREGIKKLKVRYPVWMSDIITLEHAMDMIQALGEITQKETRANIVNQRIREAFDGLQVRSPARVLYLIWKGPWMGAGKNTFIHSMLEQMGLVNCLQEARYPELTELTIKELSPDVVLLSSEPYPFSQRHVSHLQGLVPRAKIELVDGEMFSWYGSRLIQAPAYFNTLTI
jgi:ABC-type Fe3+-hydroxamate transport system substrate-binding protein